MNTIKDQFLKVITLLLFIFFTNLTQANNFLEPDDAFKLSAIATPEKSVHLNWTIASGYSLYKEKIHLLLNGVEVTKQLQFPNAITKHDINFNKKVDVYHDSLSIFVSKELLNQNNKISIQYQGCADDGLCYSPIDKIFQINDGKIILVNDDTDGIYTKQVNNKNTLDKNNIESADKKIKTPIDEVSLAQSTLEKGSFIGIILSFLSFGLLLAFTPCVLPMVPILSSIIVGNVENSVPKNGFLLSIAYSLGMVMVYTCLGVAAGLAGEGLAATLQKPSVLIFFATVLFALSLSMFDVYQLQMPRFLQDRLNSSSANMQGGRYISVFIMGALSALIVGPCVAGPLAGALIYISQSRDIFLGGLALFSMALGMSVPLLLTGASAGAVLPRAGAWMNAVKYFFGLMLLATSIWMLQSVLPSSAWIALCGTWLILTAVFLKVFDAIDHQVNVLSRFSKTLGIIFLVLGILEIIGAGLGAKDVLKPFEPITSFKSERAASSFVQDNIADKKLQFERIKTLAELKIKLQNTNKNVILDFYADWCTSCIEMDKFTFSDANVRQKLNNVLLLQIDVTKNTKDDIEIMKMYKIFGPPALLVFDTKGNEISTARVIGYLAPEKFISHLQNNSI
jgi:thiol:disulfide interchange protein DsbD